MPIPFNMHQVLHKNYYNTEHLFSANNSQARSSGIKLPDIHSMGKNLDPNIKPEKQHANPTKGSIEKPHVGQGRAGLRRKSPYPINQTIIPLSELSQKISRETKIETRKTNHIHSMDPTHSVNKVDEGMTHTRLLIPDVPFPSRSNLQAPSQTY